MKHLFRRWLSVLLVLCLSLALAPAAMMEELEEQQTEVSSEVIEEAAEAVTEEPIEDITETATEEGTEEIADEISEESTAIEKNSEEETIQQDDTSEKVPVEPTEDITDNPEEAEEILMDDVDEDVEEQSFDFAGDSVTEESAVEVPDAILVDTTTENVSNDASMNMAEASSSFDVLDNGKTFSVQGKSISASLVANQNNCWTYASAIYNKIWGASFASDFTGSVSAGYNSLRQLSDADRTLTVDHLKSFVGNAQLGAALRICGCTSSCSSWSNDGLACGHRGHSVIIVQKDSNGFTTVENSRATSQSNYAVWTRYYSWQGFVNYWGNSGYSYVKYIKWPNAPVYDGSSVQEKSVSTLQFINVVYPKTYRIDTTYGWTLSGGTLASNVDLTSIKSEIFYASGTLLSVYGPINISGKSFSIPSINTGVKFSQITYTGDYIWRLTAKDKSDRTLVTDMPFTAVSSGSTVTATKAQEYLDKIVSVPLYSEKCTYKITKAFSWRNGPSVSATVVGQASAGETFTTDTVIWNKTTNNMWVKKAGEEKYVFAGLKYSNGKWSVDNSQTQYLQFVSDDASVDWSGCNVGGSHKKGDELALKGTITCSNTMKTIKGEFYNGSSCWGNPTSKYNASGTSYSASSSSLDSALSFSGLPASNNMKLVISVEHYYNRGQKTGTKKYEVGFTIVDETKDSDTSGSGTGGQTGNTTNTISSVPSTMTTISAVKKNSKTTVSAAPGTVYRLDLGGKTGKSFKSSKKKVATVDQSGLVTVKAAGKTKITFKVGKKKRTVTLTVKDPTIPTRVTLSTPTTAVKAGDTVTLTVTLPKGTTSGIKWSTSNRRIAMVSNGVVTFKRKGRVTITATTIRGKKKANIKFNVNP